MHQLFCALWEVTIVVKSPMRNLNVNLKINNPEFGICAGQNFDNIRKGK